MKTDYNKIKAIILSFENNEISLETALKSLLEETHKEVKEYELLNYWRSESIDDYVNRLIAEPVSDWEGINDEKALVLIKEIVDNIGNDAILEVNGQALEKRFSKPTGTISDWIFQDDIVDSNAILKLLKEKSTFLL